MCFGNLEGLHDLETRRSMHFRRRLTYYFRGSGTYLLGESKRLVEFGTFFSLIWTNEANEIGLSVRTLSLYAVERHGKKGDLLQTFAVHRSPTEIRGRHEEKNKHRETTERWFWVALHSLGREDNHFPCLQRMTGINYQSNYSGCGERVNSREGWTTNECRCSDDTVCEIWRRILQLDEYVWGEWAGTITSFTTECEKGIQRFPFKVPSDPRRFCCSMLNDQKPSIEVPGSKGTWGWTASNWSFSCENILRKVKKSLHREDSSKTRRNQLECIRTDRWAARRISESNEELIQTVGEISENLLLKNCRVCSQSNEDQVNRFTAKSSISCGQPSANRSKWAILCWQGDVWSRARKWRISKYRCCSYPRTQPDPFAARPLRET